MKTASALGERGMVKSVTEPSRRMTDPVGVPLVVESTWAVRVMEEPMAALELKLLRVMSVAAGLIARLAAGEGMA